MSSWDDMGQIIIDFMNDDPLTVYYQRPSATAVFDATTGENFFPTIEIPCKGILLDLTMQSNGYSTKYGTLIGDGDKELLMLPPEKNDPYAVPLIVNTATDFVRIGSITYNIAMVKSADPTGSAPLLYSFHIKR